MDENDNIIEFDSDAYLKGLGIKMSIEADEKAQYEALAKLTMQIYSRTKQYVPVKTGALKNSLYFKSHEEGYNEIGYDPENKLKYAIYVHEIIDNYHEFPTQSKFLEDAAFEVYNELSASYYYIPKIKIQYNPLRIFIGYFIDSLPGEYLTDVKRDQAINNSEKALEYLTEAYKLGTYSEMEKLNKFVDFYVTYRHRSTDYALRLYLDRIRHE